MDTGEIYTLLIALGLGAGIGLERKLNIIARAAVIEQGPARRKKKPGAHMLEIAFPSCCRKVCLPRFDTAPRHHVKLAIPHFHPGIRDYLLIVNTGNILILAIDSGIPKLYPVCHFKPHTLADGADYVIPK